ncbi:hypothetical protein A2U01_0083476, partial [Trifolium medium]|nr:hypothetical protein [Trifolium medium]
GALYVGDLALEYPLVGAQVSFRDPSLDLLCRYPLSPILLVPP